MDRNVLIGKILEERRRKAQAGDKTYYMMNLRHPVVAVLYDLWIHENGTIGMAPGDKARTEFELDMMSGKAIELLEQHYGAMERLKKMIEGEKE